MKLFQQISTLRMSMGGKGGILRSLNPDFASLPNRSFVLAVYFHDFCTAVGVQLADGVGGEVFVGVTAEDGAGCFRHAPTLLCGISVNSMKMREG
jgi:hypothetical protein